MPSATPKPLVHALASASAELASCLVLAPAEVIKQNPQMTRQSARRPDSPSASIQALRKVWRGPAGPARNMRTGYTALVARNLPSTSIHFPLFEFVRAQIWARRTHEPPPQTDSRSINTQAPLSAVQDDGPKPGGANPTVIETGVVSGTSAALSGALAALITTPADGVKTQIMLSAGEPAGRSGGGGRGKLKGSDIVKEIIREEGLKGIFRGGMLRASWAALGGGLYLGSYEAAKVSLQGAEKASRPNDGF